MLERGQQYKRLKALYEAEHPETKRGVAGATAKHNGDSATVESTVAESFVKDTSTKAKVSEAAIYQDIQVATNISNEVQAIIKDLPVADNKSAA